MKTKKDEYMWSCTVYNIGWSALALFTIFKIGHISAYYVYFKEFNSKNSARLAVPAYNVCTAKFKFSKKTQGS